MITCIEFAFLLQVFEHKEARSGKVCPVRISAPLLVDLKSYAATTPETTTVPYLFLTQTGNFITPSVSVKIRVITKLPNCEQSSKGRVKTHKYIQTDKICQQHTVKMFRFKQYWDKIGITVVNAVLYENPNVNYVIHNSYIFLKLTLEPPKLNKETVVYAILFMCYLFQAMSKLVQTEWMRFQVETNLPPTKMTASRQRKLAVTTIRDAGASREEQTLLARHMAHSVETADRYYDRSHQTEGRHAVLDIIHQQYRVS